MKYGRKIIKLINKKQDEKQDNEQFKELLSRPDYFWLNKSKLLMNIFWYWICHWPFNWMFSCLMHASVGFVVSLTLNWIEVRKEVNLLQFHIFPAKTPYQSHKHWSLKLYGVFEALGVLGVFGVSRIVWVFNLSLEVLSSLLTLLNVPIDEVCQKFGKMHEILKIGNFWDFCHFWCQFETFSIRTLQLSLH